MYIYVYVYIGLYNGHYITMYGVLPSFHKMDRMLRFFVVVVEIIVLYYQATTCMKLCSIKD